MGVCYLEHLRTRRKRRPPCRRAWVASLLLHGLATAVAWAVTAPIRYDRSALIGEHTRIELAATMTHSEFSRPAPAPEEQLAQPIRIMPVEAEIARRHFRVESTSTAHPTAFERARVERMLAEPRPSRRSREPSEPTLEVHASNTIARQSATRPLQRQPGTTTHPLPELIESPPPTYPQSAIERRWEGTVLLRLGITQEGRVDNVEIVRSSGYDVLDGEAVRAVRAWRFVPAMQDGRPVTSVVRLPVRFELVGPGSARS